MKTLAWILFAFFAVLIGIYPLFYVAIDMSQGLLASKAPDLRQSFAWQTGFYVHIFGGSIALLAGWSQFSRRFRNKNLPLHKLLGKVYLTAVMLSGTAGLYIAFYATGGLASVLGFSGLAISWLFTTVRAYASIRGGNVDQHQHWMIRSYALCFAAVTLRIWLPLFQFVFAMDFIFAYRIIAWMCWVPNLVVAELIVRNLRSPKARIPAHG